jgi:hypothetical protein
LEREFAEGILIQLTLNSDRTGIKRAYLLHKSMFSMKDVPQQNTCPENL